MKNKNIIEFVFNEAVRIQKLLDEVVKNEGGFKKEIEKNKNDFLCSIPRPNGVGNLTIGVEANTRIHKRVQEYLEENSVGKRINAEDFLCELKNEIVYRFLEKKKRSF